MSKFWQKTSKYLLIIPAIMAVGLGILADGAVRYAIESAKETAVFEAKLKGLSLKQLMDINI